MAGLILVLQPIFAAAAFFKAKEGLFPPDSLPIGCWHYHTHYARFCSRACDLHAFSDEYGIGEAYEIDALF